MRERYQNGTVQLALRNGIPTWIYRWTERTESGRVRRSVALGSLQELPTKTQAIKAAEPLRLKANGIVVAQRFQTVVDRYIAEELPPRFSTRKAYLCYLRNYVIPHWGQMELRDITPLAVTNWLRGLNLAGKTKAHLRGLVHILFEHAMFWGYIPIERNPMELVKLKQSTRREREPRILTKDEFEALLNEITDEPFRTMVLLDMCLGLRCSELLALKWMDVDWDKLTILVRRAIVSGHVDDVKTRYSRAAVPLDPAVAEVLHRWKLATEFKRDEDWIFASPFTAGERPYLQNAVQQHRIAPAGRRIGIERLGWHDLRHTYRSWLSMTGAPITVQKDLMRHSSVQTTMNIYGGALSEEKREANRKVVQMVLTAKAGA
jgi:integrase